MDYIKTPALVLRSAQFGESSRMLTVLTAEHGLLSVAARGALRKNSRMAAAVQPLVCSDMTLSASRSGYTLTEAVIIEQFTGLTHELPAFSLGAYIAELLETVADSDVPSPGLLSLGLNALFALSENIQRRVIVKAATELRLLCISGFTPVLEECVKCGSDNNLALFGLTDGTLCGLCASPGAQVLNIDDATLAALRYVVNANLKRLYSFNLKEPQTFAAVCERYTLAQLDRTFKTLGFYRSINETNE